MVSVAPTPDDPIYVAACTLAMKGYRLIRLRPGTKIPFDDGWPEIATNSAEMIDRWFMQPDQAFNLGLACGPQPNGMNLLAIDIDPKNGGREAWDALVERYG